MLLCSPRKVWLCSAHGAVAGGWRHRLNNEAATPLCWCSSPGVIPLSAYPSSPPSPVLEKRRLWCRLVDGRYCAVLLPHDSDHGIPVAVLKSLSDFLIEKEVWVRQGRNQGFRLSIKQSLC